ncbi:MAG TPA: lipase maturation factor family protein [Candidatus Limnocylindrales bacterium]|nr:lipase maturation factor family protein [Candidatus Limnocylindrales bacterium]
MSRSIQAVRMAMPDLAAPDYTLARLIIERGLALVYLVAFVVALRQFPALCGERGLEPAPAFLARVRFLDAPSLFHWGYTDRRLRLVSWVGIAVSALLLLGLPQRAPLPVTMLGWFTLWVLYQSISNIGGTFYSFGWESLLLEAGFLAIFLGNDAIAPPWLVILAFRWLAFRVEFGAGLIKLRGDRCWRDLTCMEYHHETQPMPNPLSWFFHHLPRPLHRIEVVGNFMAQLVLPFGLFLPQPFASVAGLLMIATQLYLVVSGNYAWLNWVTILAIVAAIADPSGASVAFEATSAWFTIAVLALTVAILVLSWWPVRNMASPGQAMNASFNPFRLVNTYGAFGSVSRDRIELVIEGTDADEPHPDAAWREYGFKGKPDDPTRLPPQVAPYHLRLDWLLWFIPLSPAYGGAWFVRFVARLLEGDAPTLRLLRRNPFPDRPPRFVRARFFRYRFTTWRERRELGAWWVRRFEADYLPPVGLDDLRRAGA